MPSELHPALPLFAAAVLSPLLGRLGRRLAAVAAPLLAFVLLANASGEELTWNALGHDWVLLHVTPMGRLFAAAFALYGCIAGLYAWSEDSRLSRAASLGLAGGAIGVTLAGDLLTLFFFWEWLSISSLFLIWSGGTRPSLAAGYRYLLFHIAGGLCLLAGILIIAARGGGASFGELTLDAAGILILIGFAANAAVPPLHAWLPDAYPEASPAGTVFLSAFTTKTAVYALARGFPGAEVLVWAGVAMALYGVVFAVLENDIRRLLAYHIVSQVGYMVAGVGLGTSLALNGTSAHAFSHIFYKGLLMMSAGAVIHATGRRKLTELGGLAAWMPATLAFCMIGAFSISGVPLFNGFVSKSIIVSAAAEERHGAMELLLIVASMGTFLHTGLKLPYFTFLGRKRAAPPERRVPLSMMAAMGLAAAVCIVTGVAPSLLYRFLPHGMDYAPYTADHVVQALQLLCGTALGFWLLRSRLGGEPTVTLDVDRLYRGAVVLGARGLAALGGALGRAGAGVSAAGGRLAGAAATAIRSESEHHPLAVQVAVIVTCLVVIILLALAYPFP
jgi:multicomponent Na+:H+ antiporter subunit D